MTKENDPCGDCGVLVGQKHDTGCDVARCKGCGNQQLQCGEHSAFPMTVWTGEWPGDVECREWGWWSKFVPAKGWEICDKDDPAATEDLNRLAEAKALGQVQWDSELEHFVKKESVS